MIILDTDSMSLLMQGHARIIKAVDQAEDEPAITIISRIEVLQGRFASILKASDRNQLIQAQELLFRNEDYMSELIVLPINDRAASEFDRLRQNRKLKKIGRADLLIASITLAHQATLVTRNLRHFRKVPGLKSENWAD